jgi:hypothetical protein
LDLVEAHTPVRHLYTTPHPTVEISHEEQIKFLKALWSPQSYYPYECSALGSSLAFIFESYARVSSRQGQTRQNLQAYPSKMKAWLELRTGHSDGYIKATIGLLESFFGLAGYFWVRDCAVWIFSRLVPTAADNLDLHLVWIIARRMRHNESQSRSVLQEIQSGHCVLSGAQVQWLG